MAITWTELVGSLTGLVCVYLVARASIWNWPLGIANTLLYTVVFLRARLYGDALLQVVFALLNGYGWWSWTRPGERGAELPVRRATPAELALAAGVSLGGTAAAALVLARHTDSPVPLWDASVLVLARRHLGAGQEVARVVVDLDCGRRDLRAAPTSRASSHPTALLYALFLGLCLMGLREWSRLLREQRPVASAA